MTKIAINCAFYYPKAGGIKEYIYNLVWNLHKLNSEYEFVLYVPADYLAYAEENLPKEFRKISLAFSSKNPIKRSLLEGMFWRQQERIEKFDLFHSPFFHAPKFKHAKIILTVHDLRLEVFPNTYAKLRYYFLKYKVPRSIKRANHIISISEFTKSEIIKFYSVPPNKITAILEAVNRDFFNEKNISSTDRKVEGKFVFSVGHVETRKNYLRLIDAFERFCDKHSSTDLKLVIVGQLSHDFDEFLTRVKENSRVIYLNFVDSNTLLWLYKNAEFFIMPSYYEGFGFPPLEAASLETISAVSNTSSLPEVCGEAAFYFDPFDVFSIEQAFERLIFDEKYKESLLEKTKVNLERFSWKKNAADTIGVYAKLLDK